MQKPCPQPLFQTPPAMKRTSESSRHYNWFVTKRSRLSTGTPLNCKDHPFFEDIVKIPEELKSFYNRVFLVNGDIFEDFMFECAPVKKLILEGIYQGLRKLKTFNIPMSTTILYQRWRHSCCKGEDGDRSWVDRQGHWGDLYHERPVLSYF